MPATSQTLPAPVPSPRSPATGVLLMGLAVLVYGVLGWAAWLLAEPSSWVAPLFPAAGIGLAIALTARRWALLALAAAAFFAYWSAPGAAQPTAPAVPTVAAALACVAVLQAWLGGALTRWSSRGQALTLEEPAAILRVFGLGAVAACAVGAAGSAAILWQAGAVPVDALASTALEWWGSNALGTILGAPAALVFLGEPRSAWQHRRGTVALPMILVSLLLALAFGQMDRWQRQRRDARFERDATTVVRAIEQRLNRYLDALEAMHSVYAASDRVEPIEFSRAAMPWLNKLPGMRAMLWDERVARADVPAFLAQMRAAGEPAFEVVDQDRTIVANDVDVLAVRLVEPLPGNSHVLGLNVLSVPEARPALLQALAADAPVATAGFKLAIGDAREQGIVVYRAVRVPGQQRAVRGVVALALRIGATLDGLADDIPAYLRVCLIDPDAAPGTSLAGPPDCARADTAGGMTYAADLTFAERRWQLRVLAPRGAQVAVDGDRASGHPDAAATLLVAVGAAAAAMLAALLLLVTGRTRRVESAVQARTRELEREVGIRQFSELALRESEQRFRSIIDSVPVGIVYTDLGGRIYQCNPQFARMLGRTEGELIDFECPQYTHPDDLEEDQAQREAVASGQLPIARRRKRLLCENGDVLSVRFTMTLLRDAQGQPSRLVSAVEDISEHLRLEVAERARETAESASRAKSDFLSRMSHELRTPLNAMLGFAQLLDLDRTEPLRERHRLWVVQIQQAGWHLLEMINDVLDLSRIESGTVSLQLEPLPIEKLIAHSMTLVEPQAQAQGVTITRRMAPHPPLRVMADATRVKQILSNLLSNAVKYNRPGGTVTVSTRIALTPHGEPQLELDVSDDGIGMTPQQLAQLFQPFNRLGRERGNTEGTGIGLVIAKLLAERQGGALEASSTEGSGSTFRLRLPLTEEASAFTGAGALDAGDSDYHRRRVLYIEDNETNVEVMRGIFLLRPQIELHVATTGLDGLAAVRTAPPDLVLLDMNLPDIEGMALLQHLQADENTSKIPVVVVSADALPALISATLHAGATRYLTKPVAVDEMLGMLDDLLSQMNTRYG